MKVIISGAGIAGLATAGFLLQQGIEAVIVEKASEWSKIGYGISLWGNGIKMLQGLGLDEKLMEKGIKIDKWMIRNSRGDVLSELQLDFDNIPPLIAIHRADLHELLLSKVPEKLIRMNTTIKNFHTGPHHVTVVLSNGESIKADILIGADGTHSRVRELIFKDENAKATDTGMAVFSFWIPEGVDLPDGFNEIYSAKGLAILFAPVNKKKMCSIAFKAESADKDQHLQILKEKVSGEEGLLPELFGVLEKDRSAFHDKIYQLKLNKWTGDKVVLIGDAAHALHPIVGMGASLALEDSYVLAQEILDHKYGNMNDAFHSFQERRQKRIRKFYRQANITSEFTFLENEVLASLRDKLVKSSTLFEGFFIENAHKIAKDVLSDI